jgi:aminoglycoside phosphotransferase (APT) family kinase protein
LIGGEVSTVESLTKRRVSEEELARLVDRGFGPARVAGWCELTGGTYNAVYAVGLDDGREFVLKVAPPPGLKLLTHEVDLLRTEVDFYQRAARAGVPVPEVAYADFNREMVETDYAFLSLIPGDELRVLQADLPAPEVAAVRVELAALAARLHTVTGPAYGYPLRGSRSWQPTWRGAFGAMVDDILADARRLGKPLPATPDRIGELMHRHAEVLDDVDHPALVHFDLWDGNVFVTRGGDGARVAGLIDGERAFFGDPVAEFVSMALFRDLEEVPELLAGYAEGSGVPFTLTASVRRRLNLYTAYLYVIMAIEGATRGWHEPARLEHETWLVEKLDHQLALLSAR